MITHPSYYDIHEYRFGLLKNEVLNLQLPNKSSVLDVGCYPPYMLDFFEKHFTNVYGIASQHESIKHENVSILNIETDTFKWQKNTFELVLFSEVIEHLVHDPRTPLKEIVRILKPGGSLIITTPNAAKLHHRLQLLLGRSVSFPIDQLYTVHPNDGSIYHLHHREYTLDELIQVVSDVGLSVKKAQFLCLYPPTRKKTKNETIVLRTIKWLGYGLQLLIPQFRDSLYVQAVKL